MSDAKKKTVQHTPGPWEVEYWNGTASVFAIGPDGVRDWVIEDNPHRSRADMALIAAAPELLEALEGVLAWYAALPNPGDVPDSVTLGARLREARAAIARARGGG